MSDISLSVLDQGETWTDATGTTHRIAEMEARYCRNIVAFLQRQVDQITWVAGLAIVGVGLPDEHTDAYLSVTAGIDAELERMHSDPAAWLNDKPLIKALLARAGQGD